MARLGDPTPALTGDDKAALEHMAAARSESEGRPSLGQVYVRMFNNPPVARAVGALGEQLRFHGVLPAREREVVILRYAAQRRLGYAWAHHQRPAHLAGLDDQTIEALLNVGDPSQLPEPDATLVAIVDSVVSEHSVPEDVQARVVASHGEAGAVEVVALCGLYGMIGSMVRSFDIPVEKGMPPAPF